MKQKDERKFEVGETEAQKQIKEYHVKKSIQDFNDATEKWQRSMLYIGIAIAMILLGIFIRLVLGGITG